MEQHPITNYIKEAQSHGMSNQQIVSALTEAGWHVQEILEIVLSHVHPTASVIPEIAMASRPSDAIISVNGLTKQYGKLTALDNVSLNVKKGAVTALLGPNGAGKTTLVKILTTLIKPTSGSATVADFNIVDDAQALRAYIGLAGQYAAVDETLTGRENLEMVGRLYHLNKTDAKKRSNELLQQFNLEDAADRVSKTYSGGMRRRLDLAASLVVHPKILFLDEPTTGLDPSSRFTLWQVIRDLVEEGTTVMLTTQYLEEADQLANYIFVIDHGHIIAQGTPNQLKNQAGGDVLELHLDNKNEADKAVKVIQKFSQEKAHIDNHRGVITIPVTGGVAILVDVIRELDSAKIMLVDIMLRRPSLDDVFIKLTGHEAI